MSPNHKDLAEFARLALRYNLLGGPPVVAWADSVIAESEYAPTWAIDLALARPQVLEEALRADPGEPQGDLPVRLLLALVRRLWRSAGLTIGQVRGIAWDLYRASPDQFLWGACLEVEGDLFDAGYGTEEDLRASIGEKFAPYEVDDAMLPAWAQNTGSGEV